MDAASAEPNPQARDLQIAQSMNRNLKNVSASGKSGVVRFVMPVFCW